MSDALERLQRIRGAVQHTAGEADGFPEVMALLLAIDEALDDLEIDIRHAIEVPA